MSSRPPARPPGGPPRGGPLSDRPSDRPGTPSAGSAPDRHPTGPAAPPVPSGTASNHRGTVEPALRWAAKQALALADEQLLAQCEESFYTAGGPGGQHRNKTESGVRLVHLPTGVGVSATERRSQLQNRLRALERLREALERLSFVPKARKKTAPTRSSKRRRLEDKRKAGARKAERRTRDW